MPWGLNELTFIYICSVVKEYILFEVEWNIFTSKSPAV